MFKKIWNSRKWELIAIIFIIVLNVGVYVSADAEKALQYASKVDAKFTSAKVEDKSINLAVFGDCGYWDIVKFDVYSNESSSHMYICKSLFGYSAHAML